MVKNKQLRTELSPENAKKFGEIKKHLNLKRDAEVVRFLIGVKHRELKEKGITV